MSDNVLGLATKRFHAAQPRAIEDRGNGGHDADREFAKACIFAKRVQESFDHRGAETLADDDAVDVPAVEVANGSFHTERADNPHPLSDPRRERRIVTAAPGDEDCRIVERVGRIQQRHVGPVMTQRIDPPQHRGMERADAKRRRKSSDQQLLRCVRIDRQHIENGGAALIDPRQHRNERCRQRVERIHYPVRNILGRDGIWVSEQDGRRLDTQDRARGLSELALHDRERTRRRKAGRQLAVGAVGNDKDRTGKRHATVTSPAESARTVNGWR